MQLSPQALPLEQTLQQVDESPLQAENPIPRTNTQSKSFLI
jgi:hypothetical protein